MSNNSLIYRITFRKHPYEGDDSFIIERLLVQYCDLYSLCDWVFSHYPECFDQGNFIKIEEVRL